MAAVVLPTAADVVDKARRELRQLLRRLRGDDRRVVTLPALGPRRGAVLFSYILDPFLEAEKESPRHTQVWESWAMAETWRELGYEVDCVSWKNGDFWPQRAYDFAIDVRTSLEKWVEHLPPACVKILHIDTGHYSFNNAAHALRQARRQARRGGPPLDVRKDIPANRGIESADCATVLGNAFTQGTYAFAGKPLIHVPVSVPFTYELPENKDFERVKNSFLWFGSEGLVHKGLDLALETFAGLPECRLTVCGPIRRERQFLAAYRHELYRTPNIRVAGWVDVAPASFEALAADHLGVLYPSCCEGGGASVLTCMHAGLIPLINPEVSVDLDAGRGVPLTSVEIADLRAAVRGLAARPAGELAAMARAAREWARAHHAKEHFRAAYRRAAEQLIDGGWRRLPPPAPLDPSLLSLPVEPRFAEPGAKK